MEGQAVLAKQRTFFRKEPSLRKGQLTMKAEQIILSDGKGAVLTRTRFIYKNKTYPLQYIAGAKVQECFLTLPKLQIIMKSGNSYTFKVGNVSNRAIAQDALFDANLSAMRGESRANATQWATTITMLLATLTKRDVPKCP